jgi:hypothetical protein
MSSISLFGKEYRLNRRAGGKADIFVFAIRISGLATQSWEPAEQERHESYPIVANLYGKTPINGYY